MLILGQLASSERFFEAPEGVVRAIASRLPEGTTLRATSRLDDFRAALPEATGVVGWPFPSAWLRHAKKLRFIHLFTAGVPEGLEAACGDRIALSNSVGANAESVADHALFLVLAGARGVSLEGLSRWAPDAFRPGRPVAELRVVVVGAGPVGLAIASRLAPIVAEVRLVSRTKGERAGFEVHGYEALDGLVAAADVVVLALPNRPETRALFMESFFASVGSSCVVVNVGRGALVEETRLLTHLGSNPEARYLADVAVPEPYPEDGPLRACPQVVLTPHVAGRSIDLWSSLATCASDAVERAVRAIIASEER